MATKSPIQEERIQNVSAPRAEPRAANLIIPRRDLLTGAALVLVGSASGCASNAQATGCPHPVRTQFMADFTAKFIGDPTKIKTPGQPDHWPDSTNGQPGSRVWPPPKQCPDQIAADFATFVKVLMAAGYVGGSPPANASGLELQIWQYLQSWDTTGWPAGSPQLSNDYDVHLVEIAVILDRLLQAINSYGDYASNCPNMAAPSVAAASGAAASGAAASGAAASGTAPKIQHHPGGNWPPH